MSKDVIDELGVGELRELAYFATGKQLGYGMSRSVYLNRAQPDTIIKIENYADHKQNVMEWLVWNSFKNVKGIGEWLCPCHALSASGTFLVMDYARDLEPHEKPKRIPSFISDVKLDNFGMLKGRVVLRDYGTVTLSLASGKKKWQDA